MKFQRCSLSPSASRLLLLALALVLSGSGRATDVGLFYDDQLPAVRFAAGEIRRACVSRGETLREGRLAQWRESREAVRLVLIAGAKEVEGAVADAALPAPRHAKPQSFALRARTVSGQTDYCVLAYEPIGAMYGGLDLAEAVQLGELRSIQNSDHAPHLESRGIKFNIPLDARTPSYSDNSDAAQGNIPVMWSFDFWREFLDAMARHRYNVLSLWNLHPFPSLVKVPEYPDVALEDVKRTTRPMDDTFSHSGHDMVRPALLEELETVRTLSIDEKVQFWRAVMEYARDRGIDVYWFTWNIFTFGTGGKYGITPAQTNEATIAYFRASVRETVLAYPLLAGIGITAGEQMEDRKDGYGKEKWLWRTYGEGIRDAKKLQPDRKVRLIHRFHQTGLAEIQREWREYPDLIDLSFKYAIAHMYSVTNPPFLRAALPKIPPGQKTWLTVRNDDIYSFRWGDPEFARGFIRAIPGPDRIAGFYMGPDGYIWGREFLSREPETPPALVIDKQWYSFMIWGRLSYDPTLPEEQFQRVLQRRFPQVPAEKLHRAWALASRTFPEITRFFWGDIDLRWFPEACLSHPRHRGFYTVRHFMEGVTMPESGVANISLYREHLRRGEAWTGLGPVQVAERLKENAEGALLLVAELRQSVRRNRADASPGSSAEEKELRLTLGDLEAMARLGLYYASKIMGATELALWDQSQNAAHQDASVRFLEEARAHWKQYAAIYSTQYRPQLLNRVGFVDLVKLTEKVEDDIRAARSWSPGTMVPVFGPRAGDNPFRP